MNGHEKYSEGFKKYRRMQFSRGLRADQTAPEDIVWEHLRNRKFLGLKFRRQHPIKNYIVDFYCSKLKLAIEIDGKIHDFQKEYDEIRQKEIEEKRVSFIRVSAKDVFSDINMLLDAIRDFKENRP